MMTNKILVVDDNALVRRVVDAYLRERGYDVILCDGPFGVLNKVKEHIPDVILMDLNMPGLSGQRLAELLVNVRSTYGCKLIVFSSEDENIQAGMVQQGLADGYFIKKNSLDGLDMKIKQVTGGMEECSSSGTRGLSQL